MFFEFVGERLRIYYFNEFFGWSDCEDVRKIYRGIFEVFFLEFVEDVLVFFRRFLMEVVFIIEEVCFEFDDFEYLWKLYFELNVRLVGEDD